MKTASSSPIITTADVLYALADALAEAHPVSRRAQLLRQHIHYYIQEAQLCQMLSLHSHTICIEDKCFTVVLKECNPELGQYFVKSFLALLPSPVETRVDIPTIELRELDEDALDIVSAIQKFAVAHTDMPHVLAV